MQTVTQQISTIAKHIVTQEDAVEVLTWALTQPGIAFTLSARVDGSLFMQAEGVDVATVYPELGQWLLFYGDRFEVLTDEQATARGISE